MKTRDLVHVALFAAILAALGLMPPLLLPFIPVPITAQTLGVMLAGSILGARKAFLSLVLFHVLVAAGLPLLAAACHPGYAATNLQLAGPRMRRSRPRELFSRLGNRLLAQPASRGAWPTLRAASDPEARGGEYFGPGGFAEQRGHPVLVGMSAQATDAADAAWLWERSAELTGVRYDALTPAP